MDWAAAVETLVGIASGLAPLISGLFGGAGAVLLWEVIDIIEH